MITKEFACNWNKFKSFIEFNPFAQSKVKNLSFIVFIFDKILKDFLTSIELGNEINANTLLNHYSLVLM